MSVKSERRAWYAANVEAMPGIDRHDPKWIEWRDRANAHMRKVCKPGSVELLEPAGIAPVAVEVARFARVASAVAPAASDRAEYDSFIAAQGIAFGESTDAPGGVSDDYWQRGVVGREFGKGQLRHALKHLNGDAVDALERGVIRWVTFAEFKAERAALRAAELDEIAAHDAPQDCTDCAVAHLAECVCSAFAWAA